jgi:hypothetical protein
MPIKSKAQRRKFAQLLVEGKITPEAFERWNRGAGSRELPERVHPKTGSGKAKRKAAKPRRAPKKAKARAKKKRVRPSARRR